MSCVSTEIWSRYPEMDNECVFHPQSDTDRLCLTTEKGGRGHIICEGCVRSEKNNLGWYVKILSRFCILSSY